MKRVVYAFAIAAMSFAAVSCAQEVYPEDSGVEMSFIATQEEDTDTRTVLGDNGAVLWSPDDEISIFKVSGTNGGSKFTSQNSAPAKTVEFKGFLESLGAPQSGQYYWAIYPYSNTNSCDGQSITARLPANQTAVKGSFPKDCHPAMARTTGTDLRFYAIAGGLEFTVTRPGVRSISIKGNNGEALAGTYKATFCSDGKPTIQVTGAQKEVTLTAPDGSAFTPGEPYVISLLPTTLSNGVTITLITDDNKKGTINSSKSQTVRRSVFGVLIDIDNKAEWESIATIPEAVDLGLSVKWATFNVGATKPEDFGDYFAWGETEPKDNYDWSTYKWCNGEGDKLTKYCLQSSYQSSFWGSDKPIDNKTTLDLEDDAALVNWGDSWRTPTYAEAVELRENCTWTWQTNYKGTDINGYLVRSNIAGYTDKSIFLPAAGYRYVKSIDYAGNSGFYWSSFLSWDGPYNVYYLYFNSAGEVVDYGDSFRCLGFSVRPVYGSFVAVSSISISHSLASLGIGSTIQLNATVSPSNASERIIMWATSDHNVVEISSNGLVTARKAGSAIVTAYASNGMSASCAVTVNAPKAIDLGLPSGLKWASCNVGASAPEEYGDYFAWGETDPKEDYSWLTYKFRVSGDDWDNVTFYRYCTKSSYWESFEPMDNVTEFKDYGYEDDAASVWGGSWRMPTDAEWTEIREKCTWTWTTQNGVNGRLVTGPNGNSIFLPAAGLRGGTSLYDVGSWGYYWSSSLDTGYPDDACSIYFDSGDVYWSRDSRCNGFSVRPVSE